VVVKQPLLEESQVEPYLQKRAGSVVQSAEQTPPRAVLAPSVQQPSPWAHVSARVGSQGARQYCALPIAAHTICSPAGVVPQPELSVQEAEHTPMLEVSWRHSFPGEQVLWDPVVPAQTAPMPP
jgi:hypothetical protein